MPNNLFPKEDRGLDDDNKRAKGLEQAEQFAQDIIQGNADWGRIPFLSDVMGIFSQKEWTWRLLRKFYPLALDTQKCTRCKLCVTLCPVENIVMGEYPEYQGKCCICMRCISFCPSRAIYSERHQEFHPYRAVRAAELLWNVP